MWACIWKGLAQPLCPCKLGPPIIILGSIMMVRHTHMHTHHPSHAHSQYSHMTFSSQRPMASEDQEHEEMTEEVDGSMDGLQPRCHSFIPSTAFGRMSDGEGGV